MRQQHVWQVATRGKLAAFQVYTRSTRPSSTMDSSLLRLRGTTWATSGQSAGLRYENHPKT